MAKILDFAALRDQFGPARDDQPEPCPYCKGTGWRRVPAVTTDSPDKISCNGWRRVVCPTCQNPGERP